MSKFFKRAIAVLISVGLIGAIFTGCGTSKKQSSDSKATPEAQTANEKKPELRFLVTNTTVDLNNYPLNKLIQEKTGYKVTYDVLPAEKPEDKLNLLMASGEPYDLINVFIDATTKSLYNNYAKSGALTELGSYIDKFGPNIKSAISQDSFNLIKVDGKIYSISSQAPHVNPVGNSFSGLQIRMDWLDKVGMKAPTTLDEFTAVLKAFKDKDPGKNGDKNIAFMPPATNPFFEGISGAFGLYNDWNDVGGKLVPRILDPNLKDYISYVSDLFKQGLIEKEFLLNKGNTGKEKVTGGFVGVNVGITNETGTTVDALLKNKPDAKLAFIKPLIGKDGKQGLGSTGGLNSYAFIPKASKNAEHVIKYVNATLEKELFKEITIGKEGELHTVKDGVYFPIQPQFFDQRGSANLFIVGSDEKNYNNYWGARLKKDIRNYESYEVLNLKDAINFPKKNIILDAPYLPEYAKQWSQLTSQLNDYLIKVIIGAEPNSGIEAYQQKFKTQGGDAVIKEVNDWYATYKK